jgi:hypothetical protein
VSELTTFDSASPWDEQRLTRIKNKCNGIAVSVYIRGTPGSFRHASKEDVALVRAHGLGLIPNAEWAADTFKFSNIVQMRQNATEALNAALALGFPDDGTVALPLSWDYQIPRTDFARQLDHLSLCQDVFGGKFVATAYGQSNFLTYLGNHGFGDRGHWLMGSTWINQDMDQSDPTKKKAYNIGSPFVAQVQSHHLNGFWWPSPVAASDVNAVTQPNKLAAWWPDGSEFNMALSADDKKFIKDNTVSQSEVEGLLVSALIALASGQESGPFTAKGHPTLMKQLKKFAASQSTAALTAAVKAALPTDVAGLTPSQLDTHVENAVKQALREGTQ